MTTNKTSSLLSDDQFVERLVLYANQYNQIQEALRNDHQNKIIPILKEEFALNRNWVNAKLVDVLNQYKERYIHRVAKQIILPPDFRELVSPIFELRTQKAKHVASQSYEGAAKIREKELGLLNQTRIVYLLQEFNETLLNELKKCKTPEGYFTTGYFFLNTLEAYLGPDLNAKKQELERICSKWLLNQEAALLELSNLYEQEFALAQIGLKKLNWENGIMVRL
ncbi:MAG: hypothetical protein K9H61_06080 [Bacteroidia bacterium]|nr:hypothetical protein [Bacteroidia bacterium]MCF8446547.1 hypothetical protein [Bacteroidia bacterium]